MHAAREPPLDLNDPPLSSEPSLGTETLAWDRFEALARLQGYEAVLVREWAAGQATGEHRHPFDVMAVVARGGFELTTGAAGTPQRQTLRAGDAFLLAKELPHAERYGPEGATLWVARRGG